MPTPVDFYFDFSSPYGYLASCRIDAIVKTHGRSVTWRPYLMGAAMKITGSRPLVDRDMINDYVVIDFDRSARLYGIAFQMPEPFPVASVAACRAYYWLFDQSAEQAKQLAQAFYSAYFTAGRNIGDAEVVLDIATENGIDRAALGEALQDPAVKARLRTETDAAIGRGVFGSPFMLVDGEPFWGNDRLELIDRWLQTGGW